MTKTTLKLLQETTEWKSPTPNHTYIFEGSKIAGYIKVGTSEAIKFSKPMWFDKRGRTFIPVKSSRFDLSAFH